MIEALICGVIVFAALDMIGTALFLLAVLLGGLVLMS